MLPEAAGAYYRQQQRLTVATLALTRTAWATVTPDLDASWLAAGPRLSVITMSAQLGAARAAEPYLAAVLGELDLPTANDGEVNPAGFVGVAGDGRDVDSLLYGAVTTSKASIAAGAQVQEAMTRGGRWLDMAVQTLLADTARAAVSTGITARPRVGGYVRMLNLPSCSRCVILAGKWFRWNEGFARHPRCDCRHIPAAEDMAGDLRTDPQKAVEAGQVRGLTRAERAAIDDGADVGQVVNARRGMSTTSIGGRTIQVTSEGTTRRGVAFRALSRRGTVTEQAGTATRITRTGPEQRAITRTRSRAPRLTPQTIYDVAEDRADAIRLLKANGYLT